MVAKIWEDVCLSWRPLKESFKYVSRMQHYPIRGGDFPTNLYIQVVYTIGKFCTLLKKFVHYTILSEQEWAPWLGDGNHFAVLVAFRRYSWAWRIWQSFLICKYLCATRSLEIFSSPYSASKSGGDILELHLRYKPCLRLRHCQTWSIPQLLSVWKYR